MFITNYFGINTYLPWQGCSAPNMDALCAAVANVSKIIINCVFAGHGPSNMRGALTQAVAPVTAARCTYVNSWAADPGTCK